MKRSTIILLLSAATSLSLNCAEPSAFGAGDLSSDSPYGLTPDEKVILETKKKLKKVDLSTKTHASQLDSLRERIDGLQDIIEALSRKSHNNKIALKELQNKDKLDDENSNEYQKRLSEVVQQDSQSIKTLQEQVLEISKLVDQINANYVSKKEFNDLVADINNFKDLVAKELKSGSKKSSAKTKKVSSADLYNSAKQNFDKKYYTKAIEQYTELIARKYKPAYSHYMIGEMYYKRKDYAKAISYFKKSSELYAKASYMPTLMLHTAISMDKTGDKGHAHSFYKAIIKKYPSSSEAKKAKKLLN
ncbi:tetratricopeptide repeat protein [Sulfurimonas marina]|uniref:Tetratricopeptide repeat protein n=1 Tax=Sulfurimonas marina TaxID=2590551 RepID=A0A7M1AUA2_9BACT|nr:tetratricopeptide repeat protein [Sulfurimonas marina]QOP41003.1 tetratricopeptide repeat protein [Sulfurimonas marina]